MTRILAAAALVSTATVALVAAAPARAEVELSFYSGYQEAAHSRVRGTDPGGVGDFSFLAKWEGRSMSAPPYYGLRATWWTSDRLGFGAEFTHTKVYASDATKSDNGFSVLELTDGVNIFTANVMYRFPNESAFTPYIGGGLGFTVPHVEVTTSGGRTFEYQYGGPAAAALAGVSYSLNDRWSVFGEWRGTYNQIDVDLDNGGSLKTNIVTNSVNVGVSFKF